MADYVVRQPLKVERPIKYGISIMYIVDLRNTEKRLPILMKFRKLKVEHNFNKGF